MPSESPSGSGPKTDAERLLLVSSDPALPASVASAAEVHRAADAASAHRLLAETPAAVVVIEAGLATELLPELAQQEYPPPVIILGPADRADLRRWALENGALAYLSSRSELDLWLRPAFSYCRLQMDNKLIREETDRIHSELLASYGAVAEHSKVLEAEVKRRTEQLEQLVEQRTEALQRTNQQLYAQEKMAALGALVAGIAHDMHTPIGTITSNSDVLNRSLAKLREIIGGESCPESFRNNRDLNRVLGMLEDIARVNQLACDRIIGIVRSLRNFARLDEAEVQNIDLHEGLESTLTLVHHELKNRITVVKEFGDIPKVAGHTNQLNQVFMNMFVNAAHAIQGKGTITIRTWRDGELVRIRISDSGSGIKPEHLARIFDTGFTTKSAGVGTGLGLAICQRIVQDHKGTIEVESEVGRGTTFTISLPIQWKTSSS